MKSRTAKLLRGILALCLLIPAGALADSGPLDLTLPALDARGATFEAVRQVAAPAAIKPPTATSGSAPAGPAWSAGLSEGKALILRWKMPW